MANRNMQKRPPQQTPYTHDPEDNPSRKGLDSIPAVDVPNDLDRAERERQRQRIDDLARDNQGARGQDQDERSGQGNQSGHGDRGGR